MTPWLSIHWVAGYALAIGPIHLVVEHLDGRLHEHHHHNRVGLPSITSVVARPRGTSPVNLPYPDGHKHEYHSAHLIIYLDHRPETARFSVLRWYPPVTPCR